MFRTQVTDRLLRVARRSLGRGSGVQAPNGAASETPERNPASLARENKLVNQVLLELDAVEREGHTPRLEYLMGLLHLSYAFLDGATGPRLQQRVRPLLLRMFDLGKNDLDAPTESTAPLAYFVSYPRSGNTLATRLSAQATQGQVLSAMTAGFAPFSKSIYPRSYPFPRLIKDHVAHLHYMNDRCVLIARDGRDTIASLAFMTMQQDHHKFSKVGEIADFIRWTGKSYTFGSWADHMRNVLKLMEGPDKQLVRYEDLTADVEAFYKMIDFFDPGNKLPREHLNQLYEQKDSVVEGIKSKAHVNNQWGYGFEFEPDSMFHEWSLNRKGSSWRKVWDAAAKRAFHETGGTEILLELGYETDPDWWRQ